ncbi:COMM domain-containing protein 9-like [Liolophura sinensis]|uniref:COMM domain-containing protein 9-like n=1 Tax=Liolophura sinensis TaxID=3198878 RepID=UPI0031598B15
MATCDFQTLTVLLQANSKEVVVQVCNEAFLYRDAARLPESVVSTVEESLSVSAHQAKALLASLSSLIKAALFQSLQEPAEVATLFPDDFHKDLRKLLSKIIAELCPNWRNHAINNQVSLPRLVDFDWRIDLKAASQNIAQMSVPTCILQLQVQENPTQVGSVPPLTSTNVELSKETLDTMLDGLGKIRDQLSSVAKR